MKRKLLAVFVSVLLLCTMLPLGAASAEVTSGTTGKCTWTLDGTHLTISGNGKMADYDPYSSRAPWGTDITAVTIEEGVTTIGDYAFYNCDLTSVIIPDSVTSIGDRAFASCDVLASVIIPDSVTSIGDFAFSGCTSLTSVTIPDSVTSIGERAFQLCSSLTSVTIPDSVTAIGDCAFRDCSALTAIDVDEKNPSYSSLEGVLFNKEQTILIQYPVTKSGAYTIPDGVTIIEDDAFYNCRSLTSVTIPDGVKEIGEQAFMYCTSLTSVTIGDGVTAIGFAAFLGCHLESVTIPDSVEGIGMDAFLFCHWLTAIEVDENNPKYSSVDGVLFNKEQTTLIKYPGGKSNDYTIPDSVTSIGNYAFSACNSLKSVTIPNSVTTIGNQAFANCKSLTDIYYSGTEADRANIAIENGNDPLLNATWHYNYTPPCDHVYDDEYDADCNACGEVREVPEKPILYGDANDDGAINARDVALLQQYVAGWDVELGK